jgi:uncharacterized membrane protein
MDRIQKFLYIIVFLIAFIAILPTMLSFATGGVFFAIMIVIIGLLIGVPYVIIRKKNPESY